MYWMEQLHILTDREFEIAEHVALGNRTKSTAYHFSISPKTVKNHLNAIYKKLNVKNRTEMSVLVMAAKQ